jgi:hypothetical protein
VSDYTPTTEGLPLLSTEDIRDATVNTSGGLTSPELFDRWLAEHDADVAKAERERIIKIIERINNHGMTHSEKCLRHHLFAEQALKEINK